VGLEGLRKLKKQFIACSIVPQNICYGSVYFSVI
jgi:hypothetical protein